MNKLANNERFVWNALDRFEEETGWKTNWIPDEDQQKLDGILELRFEKKVKRILVEVKRDVRDGHFPTLLDYKKRYPNYLLIAGRISKRIKERLQTLKINYLDSGGNAWVHTGDLFFIIKGNKSNVEKTRIHLFTASRVQLLFYFLSKPELLQLPYREIANKSGVGLDTISKTIKILRDQHYIVAKEEGHYIFANKKGLLERWIPEYGDRLRPKLLKHRFRFINNVNWADIDLDITKTQWGGEPAADKILNNLQPKRYTLYSKESRKDLMKNYRLVPDTNGPITVYDLFWNPKDFKESQTVPKLLIYADLMLSSSARNFEVAKKLWNG